MVLFVSLVSRKMFSKFVLIVMKVKLMMECLVWSLLISLQLVVSLLVQVSSRLSIDDYDVCHMISWMIWAMRN